MGYGTGIELRKRNMSVDQALDKVYIVRAKGNYSAAIYVPKSLIGKRVKLMIVD